MLRHRVVSAVVLVLGLTLGTIGTASAGQWTEPNTWASGPSLGVSQTNRGNIVGMWQQMMGARYIEPGRDGIFGSVTRDYTIWWQWEHSAIVPGLAIDGTVGPSTWNVARFFHVGAPRFSHGGWDYYLYSDDQFDFWLPFTTGYATWFTEVHHYCRRDVVVDWPAISYMWTGSCE